jgi:hypothetical protein
LGCSFSGNGVLVVYPGCVNGGEVLERRAAKFWSTRAQRTSLAEATSDGPATEHLVAAV